MAWWSFYDVQKFDITYNVVWRRYFAMIIVAAMISSSCIYYLPVQQEALGRYHKEPEELLLLQGEKENQMVNLTHTSSSLSLFTLQPPRLISKLCTLHHYSLSHVWKPTLTVAWLIAWLKGEVLSPLLTIFATSWFQACPKCSWKRTKGLFESRIHTSQKTHVGITPAGKCKAYVPCRVFTGLKLNSNRFGGE